MRGYFWINAIVHIQKAHLQVTVDQQRANHTGSEAKLRLVSCSVFHSANSIQNYVFFKHQSNININFYVPLLKYVLGNILSQVHVNNK